MKSGELIHERYEIGKRMGHGSMARTHAAFDLQTQSEVVVKELTLDGLDNWKAYDLFEREARVMAMLSHPRIPKLVEFFRIELDDNLRLYIVSNLIQGPSLAEKLEAGWQMDEAGARDLARQLLGILIYLQKLLPPVVHRDIKPANLILDEQGQVHLVDFGAVQAAARPRGGSTVVGTFGYMAPEQFSGQATAASDLYALGATLVHLLTGLSPAEMPRTDFRLDFRPHLTCSAQMADWLEKLLEPAADKRFLSAEVALEALDRPLRSMQVSVAAPTAGPPGTKVSLYRKPQRLNIDLPALNPKNSAVALQLVMLASGGLGAFNIGITLMFAHLQLLMLTLPLTLFGLGFAVWAMAFFVSQTTVTLTPAHLQIETNFGGFQSRSERILLRDLRALRLSRGRFPFQSTSVLTIESISGRSYRFGPLLGQAEKEWLQDEMLGFLAEHCPQEQFLSLQRAAEEEPALPLAGRGTKFEIRFGQDSLRSQAFQGKLQLSHLETRFELSGLQESHGEIRFRAEQLQDFADQILNQNPDCTLTEFRSRFAAVHGNEIMPEIVLALYRAAGGTPEQT